MREYINNKLGYKRDIEISTYKDIKIRYVFFFFQIVRFIYIIKDTDCVRASELYRILIFTIFFFITKILILIFQSLDNRLMILFALGLKLYHSSVYRKRTTTI